ncbi:DNA-binding response regulator [Comamonas serinivorans]|uniref:DNA-binding response regulator n=1 Tax=Comamonas serinivorans TaxID=1082851 RepID=A0A1Y0EK39_9BURK|nr:response regulator [Comamonas serinivorans]ARU03729.1 DNA-binding response regulator [Comamonas serinivorans]
MDFTRATVYIVDDDAAVRDALAWLLRTRRIVSEGFGSAADFDAMLADPQRGLTATGEPRDPGCILLDVRMPGETGLSLFQRLQQRGLTTPWPVIFLTGHAEVATAVEAVKAGAFDFCEKPFSDNELVERVEQALQLSLERFAEHKGRQSLRDKVAALTERERAVMGHVLEGMLNKQIAEQLDISVRTVEVHRARVFAKMDVKSAVELARLLHGL